MGVVWAGRGGNCVTRSWLQNVRGVARREGLLAGTRNRGEVIAKCILAEDTIRGLVLGCVCGACDGGNK